VPLPYVCPEDSSDRSSFSFGRDPRGFDILSDIPGVIDAAGVFRTAALSQPKTTEQGNVALYLCKLVIYKAVRVSLGKETLSWLRVTC
jgi:hypothetical protein